MNFEAFSQGCHNPGKSWKVLEFENDPGKSWKVLEFHIYLSKSLKSPGILYCPFHIFLSVQNFKSVCGVLLFSFLF